MHYACLRLFDCASTHRLFISLFRARGFTFLYCEALCSGGTLQTRFVIIPEIFSANCLIPLKARQIARLRFLCNGGMAMTRIDREKFINNLSKVELDVNEIPTKTLEKLDDLGISKKQLRNIAGDDGKISGQEYKDLFESVDRFDKDGSNGSLEIRDDRNRLTRSGQLYETLNSEVQRNIRQARIQGVRKERIPPGHPTISQDPKEDTSNSSDTTISSRELTAKRREDPPVKEKQGTYIGSSPVLPAHGYAQFSKVEQKYGVKWPMDIEMSNRRKLKPEFVEDSGALLNMQMDGSPKRGVVLKHEGRTLLAAVDDNGWLKFYERDYSSGQNAQLRFDGQNWKALDQTGDKKSLAIAEAFKNSFDVANGRIDSKLDPETQKQVTAAQDRKVIGKIQSSIDSLNQELKDSHETVKDYTNFLAREQKWITPGLKKGVIGMNTNKDGELNLSLVRPRGMSDSEWQKITNEFEPKLKNAERTLQSTQSSLALGIKDRNRKAEALYEQINHPSYIRHLENLPAMDRLAEVNRVSQSLVGTPAGDRFAKDIFEERPGAQKDASGLFTPRTRLAETIIAGYNEPGGKAALTHLATSFAPHLGDINEHALARLGEISLGRRLTEKERSAAYELSTLPPDQVSKLMTSEREGLTGKLGDVADLLTAMGDAPKILSEAKPKKFGAGAPFEMGAKTKGLHLGASVVASFQLIRSTIAMGSDPSLETVGAFAEDGTRVASTWLKMKSLSANADWLPKYSKAFGITSDAIGFANDIVKWSNTKSPEGDHRGFVHVMASGTILLGGIAASPIGLAGIATGLIVKLFYDRTSEAYEETYGALKPLPKY